MSRAAVDLVFWQQEKGKNGLQIFYQNIYLLSIRCVPSTVTDPGDTLMNQIGIVFPDPLMLAVRLLMKTLNNLQIIFPIPGNR